MISFFVLKSLYPPIFPVFYFYVFLGLLLYFFFSNLDIELLLVASKYFYFFSLFFLIIPFLLGQVTRGTTRWIYLGNITIQPAEIVKPFLIVFLANLLGRNEYFDFKTLLYSILFFLIPFFLILFQPSLGVSLLFLSGFLGVFLAKQITWEKLISIFLFGLMFFSSLWFLMRGYQKQRILAFFKQSSLNYNTLQAVIAVGSGGFFGRGLGKGMQTQLAYLPERHTDFVFASIAEEIGFVGALVVLFLTYLLLFMMLKKAKKARDGSCASLILGLFLSYFIQVVVHVGMNLGLLPITGLPYPLISSGGSSFIGTMIALGIIQSASKK